MNRLLLQKISLCAALALALQTTYAQTDTMYIGPNNGLYSNSANWSNGVPINNTFHAINNTDFIIRLDIDPTINSLTLGAAIGRLFGTDHNFTVTGSTGMGAGNRLDVVAQSLSNVKFDLGNLTNFSGTTLNSGGYFVTAAPGTTSNLQFNGANIVTNSARIGLIGAGASIVDQNGANALANFTTNTYFIRFGSGYNFTTPNNFTNNGYMVVRPGSTAIFNGSFVLVGDPLDDQTGLIEVFGTDDPSAGTATGDGRFVVNGNFPAYDATTNTLGPVRLWASAFGTKTATIQFNNANIIISNGDIRLLGDNARYSDQNGSDGLRNLAVNNNVFQTGRLTRTTVGDFTNNGAGVNFPGGYMFIGGGTNLTVAGTLTNNGLLDFATYDIHQDIGVPGFPPAPDGVLPSNITVDGNMILTSNSDLFCEIYSTAVIASYHVLGQATLGGTLDLIFTFDDSLVSSTDTFTLLHANGGITGAFNNIASGGRLDAFFFGASEPSGSFRVNYTGHALTISDYQVRQTPTPTPTPTPHPPHATPTPRPHATPTPTPTPTPHAPHATPTPTPHPPHATPTPSPMPRGN